MKHPGWWPFVHWGKEAKHSHQSALEAQMAGIHFWTSQCPLWYALFLVLGAHCLHFRCEVRSKNWVRSTHHAETILDNTTVELEICQKFIYSEISLWQIPRSHEKCFLHQEFLYEVQKYIYNCLVGYGFFFITGFLVHQILIWRDFTVLSSMIASFQFNSLNDWSIFQWEFDKIMKITSLYSNSWTHNFRDSNCDEMSKTSFMRWD